MGKTALDPTFAEEELPLCRSLTAAEVLCWWGGQRLRSSKSHWDHLQGNVVPPVQMLPTMWCRDDYGWSSSKGMDEADHPGCCKRWIIRGKRGTAHGKSGRFLDVQSIFCLLCFRKCFILPMWISYVGKGPHISNRIELRFTADSKALHISGHRWNTKNGINWCLNLGYYEYKLAKK